MGCPAHLIIVAADDLAGGLFAGILGEYRVAAEIVELFVLPEDAHRRGVDHRLQQVRRLLQFRLGFLQRTLQLPVFGQFAHQAQGVVRQAAVDGQDDVDQGARAAPHLLPGSCLCRIEWQAGLQGQNGIGHVAVGFENVRRQPACQEAQCFFRYVHHGPACQFAAQAHDFLHKEGVRLAMFDFVLAVAQVFPPDRFFRGEVIHRVVGQFIEQAVENQFFRFEGDMAGQCIEQGDQLAVLLIDRGQAGIEVVVPGEDINRVHRWSKRHKVAARFGVCCISDIFAVAKQRGISLQQAVILIIRR